MVFQHNKHWHCLKMLHNVPLPSQLFQEFGVWGHTHPRWRMRMCRFIPTRDVSTFPQPGHRHLYAPLLKLWEWEWKTKSDSVVFLKHQLKTLSIHPQVLQSDSLLILTLHLLASGSSHAAWSSSMCSPSSVCWLRLLSISVTDGEGAGLTLPWSQLQ